MSLNPITWIKKAFTIFKKKSAQPDKAADAPFERDDNVVLVFGHSNAGKTVYFSVLYELLKGNPDYKLSPLDNETAASLIENFNLMRGKQLKIKEGRQVEVEGERKFPTMTSETRILKFGLDMTLRKGIKFYTVDYKGETLSIAEPGGLRKKFANFFPHARAALFFIDASVLDTDVLLREQIAAFQTIIHDLRDCAPKRMPIGIVITKADFLDGFSPSNPVELIPGSAAVYKGRGKEAFIRGLAKINSRRFGEVWARSCEKVTRTLGNLIDSMTSYNLDFQFFFISATGGLEKNPDGSVRPPRDLIPSGVPQPLIWSFNRILFNKRKAGWWRATKWVMGLSIVWIALIAIINLYQIAFIQSASLKRAEERFSKRFQFGPKPIDPGAGEMLFDDYKEYLEAFSVKTFFGTGPLIELAKARQEFVRTQISADAPPEKQEDVVAPVTASTAAATTAARKDYNKMAEEVSKLPPDQQAQTFDQKLSEFWAKHPADSLDPNFVSRVEGAAEQFKTGGSALAEQRFELVVAVENLRDKSQVTMQIGGQPEVEFSNFGGAPVVEKSVSGVGSEAVKFKWYDFSPAGTGETPTMEFANPLQDFYPKLRGGVRLDFGRDYNIIVKLRSGQPPQPAGIPRI